MAANASTQAENPYTPYLAQLHSTLYVTSGEGFKYRLFVLWALAGLAIVGGLLHLSVLVVETHRKHNESFWLFRTVQRPHGRFIVTNAKVAHVLCSITCLLLICGGLWNVYDVYINYGSFRWSASWQTFIVLSLALHVWLVSWGQLQAYLLTPPQINKQPISPLVANSLFLGLGAVLMLGLLGGASVLTVINGKIWSDAQSCRAALQHLESGWQPGSPLDTVAISELQLYATSLARFGEKSHVASLYFGAVAEALLVVVLLVNLGSIALTRAVRTQITTKLSTFSNFGPIGDHSETIESIPPLSKETRRESASSLSRSRIRRISRDGSSAQMEQARQIIVLQKAERDLVVISTLVGSIALIAIGLFTFGIYQEATHSSAKASWPVREFSLLAFCWVYTVALCATSAVLISNAVQHLPSKTHIGHRLSTGGESQTFTIPTPLRTRASADTVKLQFSSKWRNESEPSLYGTETLPFRTGDAVSIDMPRPPLSEKRSFDGGLPRLAVPDERRPLTHVIQHRPPSRRPSLAQERLDEEPSSDKQQYIDHQSFQKGPSVDPDEGRESARTFQWGKQGFGETHC